MKPFSPHNPHPDTHDRHSDHGNYGNHGNPDRHQSKRKGRRWQDRFGLDVLRARWHNSMPKFFKRVCWLSALIGGTALAVNTAIVSGGGTAHEWWSDIYPYLLGIPAGAAFVAKFTQNYDREGNPIPKPLPKADKPNAVNDSDIETQQPGDEPQQHEIEAYNDD